MKLSLKEQCFLYFVLLFNIFLVYLQTENWLSGLKRLTETQVVLRGSGVRIPHSDYIYTIL